MGAITYLYSMARTQGSEDERAAAHDEVQVTALRSSPERTVFTEDDNSDGWISTDVTVDIER
jgi:hypothetical protein